MSNIACVTMKRLCAIACVTWMLFVPLRSHAQDENAGVAERESVTVSQDRDIINWLTDIRALIDRADWPTAAKELETLLDSLQRSNEPIVLPVGPRLHQDPYLVIKTLASRLPADALELYRARKEKEVSERFAAAVARRNVRELKSISNLFALTEYGPRADAVLADAYYESGDFYTAAHYLDLFLDAAAEDEAAGRWIQLGICFKLLGIEDRFERYCVDKDRSIASLTVEGVPFKTWASTLPQAGIDRVSPSTDAWECLNGLVSGEQPSVAPLNPGALEWRRSIPDPIVSPEALQTCRERGLPVQYPYRPVSDGERIYLISEFSVQCLDRDSGSQVWRRDIIAEPARRQRNVIDRLCSGAVSKGRVYAALDRTIRCMNATTGEPLWSFDLRDFIADDAQKPSIETVIHGAKQFSQPVVADGNVYFAFTNLLAGDTQVYLVCLSADTGTLQWATFLSAHFTGDFLGMGSPISAPSCAAGQVFVTTNAGTVVCVNGDTGRIQWIHVYDPHARAHREFQVVHGRQWACQSQPILTQDSLICTPGDSDQLIALDRFSGALRWMHPRSGARFIAGPSQGMLAVFGDSVMWVDVASGRRLFETELPSPAVGPGLFSGGALWLPTEAGLVEIKSISDPAELRILEDFQGGNLLPAQGGLLVSTHNELIRYSAVDTGKAAWAAKAAQPDDGSARAKLAWLNLAEKRNAEAMRDAESAVREATTLDRQSSAAGRANALAVTNSMIALALRAGESAMESGEHDLAASWYETGSTFARSNPALPELLLRQSAALEAGGKIRESVNVSQRLMEQARLSPVTRNGVSVPAWQAALAEIKRKTARFGRECYADQEARAADLHQQALQAGSLPQLQWVAETFPVYSEYQALVFDIAEMLKKTGKLRAASSVFRTCAELRGDDAAELLLAASDWLIANGLPGEARKCLEDCDRIVEESGNATVRVELDLRRQALFAADETPALTLSTPLCLSWVRPRLRQSRQIEFIEDSEGRSPNVILSHDGALLECRDIASGAKQWERNYSFRVSAVDFHDDTVLVLCENDLFCLDAASGNERWRIERDSWSECSEGMTLASAIFSASERVYVWGGIHLVCLNSRSGEVNWAVATQQSLVQYVYRTAVGIVAIVDNPAKAYIYDETSGAELKSISLFAPGYRRQREPVLLAPHHLAVQGVNDETGERSVLIHDLATGRITVKTGFDRDVLGFVGNGTRLVVALRAGPTLLRLAGFDTANGKQQWSEEEAVLVARDFTTRGNTLVFTALQASTRKQFVYTYLMDSGRRVMAAELRNVVRPDLSMGADHFLVSSVAGETSFLYSFDGNLVEQYTIPSEAQLVQSRILGSRVWIINSRNIYGFSDQSPQGAQLRILTDASPDQRIASGSVARCLRYARDLAAAGQFPQCVDVCSKLLTLRRLTPAQFSDLFELKEGIRELQAEFSRPVLQAPRVGTPPEIDGYLNDDYMEHASIELWGMAPIETVQDDSTDLKGEMAPAFGGGNIWEPGWRGEDDLAAKLYMAWDDDNVYLAMDVPDRIVTLFDREATNFVGDCMWFAFDTTNGGGYGFHAGIYNLLLGYMKPRKDPEQEARDQEQKPEGNFTVRRKVDDSGSIYEFAIPWKDLRNVGDNEPAPPATAGEHMGFNIIISDDDFRYNHDVEQDPYEYRADGVVHYKHATKAINWTPGLSIYRNRMQTWRQGIAPRLFGVIEFID